MEAEPEQENFLEQILFLSSKEQVNSSKLKKSYLFSCIIEDNLFKITARDDDDIFLLQFRLVDWIKRKEKDFIKLVNNYETILNTIKEAIEKERLVLYKMDDFALKVIIYYTIIFKEGSISFELHKKSEDEEEEKELISKFYSESDPIIQENTRDYRAEKIDYSTDFDDEGDRSTIKLRVKNTGTCTWERGRASLQCVPEFSSLLCDEYFFDDDVQPDEETEVRLEFLKNDPYNLNPPFYTCLQLHIHPRNFEPMIVLDFDKVFKDEKKKSILIRDKPKEKEKRKDIKDKKPKIKKLVKEKEENKIYSDIESEKDNIINEPKEEKNKIKENNIEEENTINENPPKIEEKKPKKVDIKMVEGNKNNIIFNNVKVNISFNVENSNKIICVDVNENKVKFDVDKNTVSFPDKGKNKISVQEKKIEKPKKNSNNQPQQNNIYRPQRNNNADNNDQTFSRGSIQDRKKMFEQHGKDFNKKDNIKNKKNKKDNDDEADATTDANDDTLSSLAPPPK